MLVQQLLWIVQSTSTSSLPFHRQNMVQASFLLLFCYWSLPLLKLPQLAININLNRLDKQNSLSLSLFFARQPPVGRCLLIHEVSRSHTTTHHSRYDSSGRGINSSQRPLLDYTQHSQQTSMSPAGFEPPISAGERPRTYALDRAATGVARTVSRIVYYMYK